MEKAHLLEMANKLQYAIGLKVLGKYTWIQ